MTKIKCECGSTKFVTEKKGCQIGLYCEECGKWIKWLSKKDAKLFKHREPQKVRTEPNKKNQTENLVCACGSTKFFTDENGSQTGLYCMSCGKWIKWLNKEDARLFRRKETEGIEDKLMRRIRNSAVKVKTVTEPCVYMEAVDIKELEAIISEVFRDNIM